MREKERNMLTERKKRNILNRVKHREKTNSEWAKEELTVRRQKRGRKSEKDGRTDSLRERL